jgi:hypothetical protein
MYRFHPLRGVPDHPFVLNAKVEKTVKPVVFSLARERAIVP